jgi:hypothetical protein
MAHEGLPEGLLDLRSMIGVGNRQEVIHLDLAEGIDYIHFPKYEYHRVGKPGG